MAEDDGIDLVKIVKRTNIDRTFKDLVSHVKRNSLYELSFEPLDTKLVNQLNDIENKEIMNFHRDSYMIFRKNIIE